MTELMVTTTDNPYNPFDERDSWKRFDEDNNYFTENLIAHIAVTSPELTREQYNHALNEAMKEIAKYNVLGSYMLVRREV